MRFQHQHEVFFWPLKRGRRDEWQRVMLRNPVCIRRACSWSCCFWSFFYVLVSLRNNASEEPSLAMTHLYTTVVSFYGQNEELAQQGKGKGVGFVWFLRILALRIFTRFTETARVIRHSGGKVGHVVLFVCLGVPGMESRIYVHNTCRKGSSCHCAFTSRCIVYLPTGTRGLASSLVMEKYG